MHDRLQEFGSNKILMAFYLPIWAKNMGGKVCNGVKIDTPFNQKVHLVWRLQLIPNSEPGVSGAGLVNQNEQHLVPKSEFGVPGAYVINGSKHSWLPKVGTPSNQNHLLIKWLFVCVFLCLNWWSICKVWQISIQRS